MKNASFAEVLRLAGEYPAHVDFAMGVETSEESGERFFCVSISEKAPEGGWANEGAAFRSMKASIHWTLPIHPNSRYESMSRMSASSTDPDACARLALDMLRKHVHRFDLYPPTEDDAPTIEEMMEGKKP